MPMTFQRPKSGRSPYSEAKRTKLRDTDHGLIASYMSEKRTGGGGQELTQATMCIYRGNLNH